MSTDSEWRENDPEGFLELKSGHWWIEYDSGFVDAITVQRNRILGHVRRYCRATPPPLPPKEEKPIECWALIDADGKRCANCSKEEDALIYQRDGGYKGPTRIVHLVDPAPLEAKINELEKENQKLFNMAANWEGRASTLQGQLFKAEKDLSQRCLVSGCPNHRHQGTFFGDLCGPCHEMVVSGVVGSGETFIHSMRRENEQLKKDLSQRVKAKKEWWFVLQTYDQWS